MGVFPDSSRAERKPKPNGLKVPPRHSRLMSCFAERFFISNDLHIMSIASILFVCATAQPYFLLLSLLIHIESCLPIIVFRGYDQVAVSSSSIIFICGSFALLSLSLPFYVGH
jgi:hypothetical protein